MDTFTSHETFLIPAGPRGDSGMPKSNLRSKTLHTISRSIILGRCLEDFWNIFYIFLGYFSDTFFDFWNILGIFLGDCLFEGKLRKTKENNKNIEKHYFSLLFIILPWFRIHRESGAFHRWSGSLLRCLDHQRSGKNEAGRAGRRGAGSEK